MVGMHSWFVSRRADCSTGMLSITTRSARAERPSTPSELVRVPPIHLRTTKCSPHAIAARLVMVSNCVQGERRTRTKHTHVWAGSCVYKPTIRVITARASWRRAGVGQCAGGRTHARTHAHTHTLTHSHTHTHKQTNKQKHIQEIERREWWRRENERTNCKAWTAQSSFVSGQETRLGGAGGHTWVRVLTKRIEPLASTTPRIMCRAFSNAVAVLSRSITCIPARCLHTARAIE
jgi:hypothetical protein